jgi:ParB family transcriptional regulator, chromosome partitioning protein
MADDTEYTVANGWISRPFGRDLLHTKRLEKVAHADFLPNPEQPRQGRWESDELMRQIHEAGGVFEPLLVEPDPGAAGKYRIIDGHRRWVNVRRILDDLESRREKFESPEEWQREYDKYSFLNAEVTHRPLNILERLRIWVHIHRQRREWTLREKEMTAFRLLSHMSTTDAAASLGVSMKEFTKLVSTYEISQQLEPVLPNPESAISWAREFVSLAERYRPPEVLDAVKDKIRRGLIVNSKDVRALRQIVPNPEATARFLEPDAGVQDALSVIPGAKDPVRASGRGSIGASGTYGNGLAIDLRTFATTLSQYSWTQLAELRADADFKAAVAEAKQRIDELERLVQAG